MPRSLDDPDMASAFFLDGPNATRDLSSWDIGVWFENVDTIYKLETWQDHDYREGDDTASSIIVWRSTRPHETGKSLQCTGTSPAEGLLAAHDVIEAMSPPWRGWHVSPEDWMIWARARDAARRPPHPGEGAASIAR